MMCKIIRDIQLKKVLSSVMVVNLVRTYFPSLFFNSIAGCVRMHLSRLELGLSV